jgi:hypothetical protein
VPLDLPVALSALLFYINTPSPSFAGASARRLLGGIPQPRINYYTGTTQIVGGSWVGPSFDKPWVEVGAP